MASLRHLVKGNGPSERGLGRRSSKDHLATIGFRVGGACAARDRPSRGQEGSSQGRVGGQEIETMSRDGARIHIATAIKDVHLEAFLQNARQGIVGT